MMAECMDRKFKEYMDRELKESMETKFKVHMELERKFKEHKESSERQFKEHKESSERQFKEFMETNERIFKELMECLERLFERVLKEGMEYWERVLKEGMEFFERKLKECTESMERELKEPMERELKEPMDCVEREFIECMEREFKECVEREHKESMECVKRERIEFMKCMERKRKEYMECKEREHKVDMECQERKRKEYMECKEREHKEHMECQEREHKEHMECQEREHKEHMECVERRHKEHMEWVERKNKEHMECVERTLKEYMEWEFEYFLPDVNFREYMGRELKYSRLELSDNHSVWVFWNRQDDDLTLSYDHSVDSISDVCASPKIRLNIRHVLHKLISYPELQECLVQFWAPTRTLEGRTLLTTQIQPFTLGTIDYLARRNRLCEYRMGMCREYNNKFYADVDSGEDQLGLPGRVFLNQLPEYNENVGHYTLKEYPQQDLALRCEILESWALPVFEQSCHTCVGVLEIACNNKQHDSWQDKEFLGRMYDIFQEFGLRCFDGYKHCEIQDGDKNKALTTAFEELNMVYESVCEIHDLPLALTWVSCRSCNHLLQSQFQFSFLDFCDTEDDGGIFYLLNSRKASKVCQLRKRKVAGRILSFPKLLYCSNVKQFCIDELPTAPSDRCCKLGGWFTMCLQSSRTRDEIYVLEFFLPKSTENDENILTKLRLILGTMEKKFKTFKLASGQGLGEALLVEIIHFQYGQRSHSIGMIPANRFIPSLELVQDGGVMLQQAQLDQPSMDAINNVVSEAQNDSLPSLDSLQNGKVTTQVDSSDQPSMDASSNGQNVVTAEQNILVVPSSKEGIRKKQDRKHKKGGPRIDIPKKEILKCSHMNRKDAAGELGVGISTFKRVCRGHSINRWPPRNTETIQPSLPSSAENQGQTPQLKNFDSPSNQTSGTQDRIHKKGGPRIVIPKGEILKCSHRNQEDAARKLGIGISTFKRVCRGHGIDRWPPRNIEKIQPSLPSSAENQGQTPRLNFDSSSNQASGTVAYIKTGFQDADTVTIRAKCETNTIKFRLSLSSTLKELQQQVAKRLELKAGTYRIKYKDEKDELILIACDVDLQDCIQCFRSLGNIDIYITLEKKLLNSF